MGYWFLIPYFALVGIICELITGTPHEYRKLSRNTAAWCFYSLFYQIGNAIPIWFIWESYEESMLADGISSDYLSHQLYYNTSTGWIIAIALLTIILAALGMLFGEKLFKKHFERAGLAGR